jgi:hypothetical protein
MLEVARSARWLGAGALIAILQASACGSDEDRSPPGGLRDAGPDAADSGRDARPDVVSDAGLDTTIDADPDTTIDAGPDTAPDASPDGAPDAPFDAGPSAFVIGQPNASSNEGVRLGMVIPNDSVIAGTRVIVADQNNSRVLIWNAIPSQSGQQADLVLGQPDFTTTQPNYDGINARGFRGSNSVASDGTRLIVGDRFNYRVLIWNTFPTRNFQPADVVVGQPDFASATSNNGGITARSMTEPWAWIGGGKLFVSDRNNFRVLIWNTIPTQNNAPADVVLGQPSMTAATINNGGLSASSIWDPGRGWVDGTRLFVPDLANHRVLIWNTIPTANNAPADRVLGQTTLTTNAPNAGGSAPGPAGLSSPIAVYGAGNTLAVADYLNNRVLLWNTAIAANGQPANVVLGQASFTTNAAGSTATGMSNPNAVAGDGTRLLVTDRFNNRVLLYSAVPTANGASPSLAFGQPDLTSVRGNNSRVVSASSFATPVMVTGGGVGIAVADSENARVLIWTVAPGSASDGAMTVLGQPNFTSFGQFGGTASARSLCGPWAVHSDGMRLVVGEQCARRVTLWNALPTMNHQPADLAVGQPDLTTSTINTGGLSASSLNGRPHPHLGGQRLFVADPNNNRVLIWNAVPTASGTAANVVLGQPGMTSAVANNGGVSARSLSAPGVVYASGGKLFVADTGNNRVLIWNAIPAVNQAPADVVLGQPDMATGGASAASARTLAAPRAVYIDPLGRLYVADAGNNRILYWNAVPAQNQAPADGVIGQPDMSGALANSGGLTANRLQGPAGVFVTINRVYIADTGNHRLVVLPRP